MVHVRIECYDNRSCSKDNKQYITVKSAAILSLAENITLHDSKECNDSLAVNIANSIWQYRVVSYSVLQ